MAQPSDARVWQIDVSKMTFCCVIKEEFIKGRDDQGSKSLTCQPIAPLRDM